MKPLLNRINSFFLLLRFFFLFLGKVSIENRDEEGFFMWQAAMWGGISGSAVLLGALAAVFAYRQKDNWLYYGFWDGCINWSIYL